MRQAQPHTQSVVAALDAVYSVHAPDRRRAARVPFQSPLVVLPCRDNDVVDEPVTMQLQDFSAVGLGALSPTALPKGRQFLVNLKQNPATVGVVCTVAHCRPAEGGRFRIGAEFTRIIDRAAPPQAPRLDWVTPASFPRQLAPAA